MRSLKHALWVILVNLLLIVVPLVLVELYFRSRPGGETVPPNALWQRFQPYVMFTTAPSHYVQWHNEFTGSMVPASVTTNALGFNDAREFDFTARYDKAPDEKIVLFTG